MAFVVIMKEKHVARLHELQALNNVTVENCYSLPQIDDLLDSLKRTEYFTKLDLTSGYHQVHMEMKYIWILDYRF